MTNTCKWELDVNFDESICYDTSCGEAQFFTEGDIAKNSYRFCPYCGGKIVEVVLAGELGEEKDD
jgi:DNA-directed RNA polymerase subunit RPC12/RpoP